MGDLSANFSWSEMLSAATATEHGIENVPGPAARAALSRLVLTILEPERQKLNKAIVVDDAFRCVELNRACGGVDNSQHVTGEAADIRCPEMPLEDLFNDIRTGNLPYDQVILEPPTAPARTGCVHVSCAPWTQDQPRREALIRSTTQPWTYSPAPATEE